MHFKLLFLLNILMIKYISCISIHKLKLSNATSSALDHYHHGDKCDKTDENDDNSDDGIQQTFTSPRVHVWLTCLASESVVHLNFSDNFIGVIGSGLGSADCTIKGNGRRQYILHVPHNKCQTKHVLSTGSFYNTLFIRYHPSLEMEGDLLKTIVCKFKTKSLIVG